MNGKAALHQCHLVKESLLLLSLRALNREARSENEAIF